VFLRDAIAGREASKFVFTKYLSLALKRLQHWGNQVGLNTDALSFLTIAQISRGGNSQELSDQAERAQASHRINSQIECPSLIFSPEDLLSFVRLSSEPNFVGSGSVSAAGIVVKQDTRAEHLFGKIALIESADPGYDWLFSAGIVGLVTMFGGGNSHMAVRCAELSLPAAIGVGESLFISAAKSTRIDLEPENRQLRFGAA
jgi:hypothetical protein